MSDISLEDYIAVKVRLSHGDGPTAARAAPHSRRAGGIRARHGRGKCAVERPVAQEHSCASWGACVHTAEIALTQQRFMPLARSGSRESAGGPQLVFAASNDVSPWTVEPSRVLFSRERSLAVPTWLSLLLPPPALTSPPSRAACPVQPKYAKYLPHTAGRYAAKAFRKAQCPIVERLTNALMMHGAFLCSSCETTLS